jgi:hypothetical protein
MGVAATLTLLGVSAISVLNWNDRVEPLLLMSPKNVLWSYDAQENGLHVQCDSYALFRLGLTNEASFALSAEIGQKEWQGGAGIFFGYREDQQADGVITFQTVELKKTEDGRYALVRRIVRVVPGANGTQFVRRFDLGAAPLPIAPKLFKQHLEVVVERGELVRVLWDGTEIKGLVLTSQPSAQVKTNPEGYYGIFSTRGETKFQRMSFHRGSHT